MRIRAHRIGNLAGHMDSDFADFDDKSKKYGPEFIAYLRRTYQRMTNEPQLRIKIVGGLDDLCKNSSPTCPLRGANCEAEEGLNDFLCMHYYDLTLNQEYIMAEIHDKIKQFRERYRVAEPLDLFDAEKSTLTVPESRGLLVTLLKKYDL